MSKKPPYVIVWRVTETCNLGCAFCLYDKNINKPRGSANPHEIKQFIDILKEYANYQNRDILLSWIGGEPFMWPELEALSLYAVSKGISISTTTNGTKLGSSKLRKHILENYSELTFSIDAIGKTHEELREWKGGYNKLIQYIRMLEQERIVSNSKTCIKANIVLMKQTIDYFPELCHELADIGVKVITFNQLGGRDRPEFYPDHRLTIQNMEFLRNVIPSLSLEMKDKGVCLATSEAYLERIEATTLDKKIRVENCYPSKDFLFIDELGRIAPCSFTNEAYAYHINNISNHTDILNLQNIFRDKQINIRAKECDDCHSTQQFAKFGTS